MKFFVHLFVLLPIASFCLPCNASTPVRIEFSNLAKILPWEETPGALSINGVKLYTGRESIGCWESWIDVLVKLDAKNVPVENTGLLVSVRNMESRIMAQAKSRVESSEALIRIDMRSLEAERALVRIEWRNNTGILLGMGETWVSADKPKSLESGTRIPVKIDIPEGIESIDRYPVRFGLPLPRGSLWQGDGLKVMDASGREVPSQLEIAGRWSEEGSVKWIWVDALVSGRTGEEIYVVPGERTRGSFPAVPVRVEKNGGRLIVKTGPAEYVVGSDGALIKEVRCNNKVFAREGTMQGLYVIDQKGRLGKVSSKDASMRLESEGPVSSVIRIEGDYVTTAGEILARHITRLKFTAGRPEAEATHTLIITRDTGEVWFRDIGWELEVLPGTDTKAIFSMTPANSMNPADGKIVLQGWKAINAKETAVSEKIKFNLVSLPLSEGKVYSSMQKEGATFGLRPNVYSWTRQNPSTPWIPYLRGKNMAQVSASGSKEPVCLGEKIGDWAGVEGRNGGFMFSCRDASAQHPKEMEVAYDRINMKLYSSSVSGIELDFKMENLMKNWGMLPIEKVADFDKVSRNLLENYTSFVLKHSSNAVGWSKTHELLFSPFFPGNEPGLVSFLHSRQVFAHVSPDWIRKTEAFGALHPVNRKDFPLEETLISNLFWGKVKQGLGGEIGGFIDYNAGPIWIIHDLRGGSYTIRSDSWYLYARSGDRSIREFAQGANRAFLDNNISHWSSKNKTKGLILENIGSPGSLRDRNRPLDLPLYWVGKSSADTPLATSGNLNQALFDYYITGNRRAGDILENYSNAIKENLTSKTRHWRVISVMRNILESYEFSWEPRLKELIYELTAGHLYDPESEVFMTKARPHRSSTYKMETDGDVFIMLFDIFGDRLFHKMAKTIAVYNWEKSDISPPIYGQNRSTGYMGYFLWKETFSPSVASRFDYSRRRLVAERQLDSETGEINLTCVSQIPRYFKGLPLAMDVIKEAKAKKIKLSSYIAFKVEEPPARLFFVKPGEDAVKVDYADEPGETHMELLVRQEGSSSAEHFKGREEDGVIKPWVTGNKVRLKPYSVVRYIWAGHDLHTVTEKSYGIVSVHIPKDAPGGLYEIEVNGNQQYSVFADKCTPLAIYAPDGWMPPAMSPPEKICFRMPEGAKDGKIFFEKGALLFAPDGKPFGGNKSVSGWVELPCDKAGLWTFESVEPGKVKVENLPAFFAMGNEELYSRPLKKKKAPLEKVSGSLDWPLTWRVFGPFHQNDPVLPVGVLNSYPEKVKIGNKQAEAADVEVKDTIYDFPDILKKEPGGSVAYVFIVFNSDREQDVTLGMGADWWMQAWVNGEPVHDTTETSNIYYPFSIWNHLVNVKVKKGRNILAVRYIRSQGSQLALGGPDQLRVTPLPPEPGELKDMSLIEKEFNLFMTGEK